MFDALDAVDNANKIFRNVRPSVLNKYGVALTEF